MWTMIGIWCGFGALVIRVLMPLWPFAEVVLCSPFWPLIAWAELKDVFTERENDG